MAKYFNKFFRIKFMPYSLIFLFTCPGQIYLRFTNLQITIELDMERI